ncbi:hypothetical protein, partial [Klebsiella oxytoca]|uniref:hypothetical protein n=1 Tax=Klebsiella oxytoca TaxID=571 RepID=UPI001CCA28FC
DFLEKTVFYLHVPGLSLTQENQDITLWLFYDTSRDARFCHALTNRDLILAFSHIKFKRINDE